MAKHYDVRISERIVKNRMRCSFIPESAHEVAEIVRALPNIPRVTADRVMRELHQKMVEDLGFMSAKNIGEIVFDYDRLWVEFIGDKKEDPVVPPRAGVYLKKMKPEEVTQDSPLTSMLTDNLAYFIIGHVVIVAPSVPQMHDPVATVRGYMFDPFRIIIPVYKKEDGSFFANDFSVESLVNDEISQQLIQEVMLSSSRIVCLALYVTREVAQDRMKATIVEPTPKFVKIMATKKPEPAALMPHYVIIKD